MPAVELDVAVQLNRGGGLVASGGGRRLRRRRRSAGSRPTREQNLGVLGGSLLVGEQAGTGLPFTPRQVYHSYAFGVTLGSCRRPDRDIC